MQNLESVKKNPNLAMVEAIVLEYKGSESPESEAWEWLRRGVQSIFGVWKDRRADHLLAIAEEEDQKKELNDPAKKGDGINNLKSSFSSSLAQLAPRLKSNVVGYKGTDDY